MRRRVYHVAGALLLATAVGTLPARSQARVDYEVSFPNAVHHEAEITVTFTGVPPRPLELRMSRSSPGRYALHEFGKNVYAVRAEDGRGNPLRIVRPNPYQWDIPEHDGTVRVRYTLFADRADGTYSGIDATHAHLNIPATFMWARGADRAPITVKFHVPEGSGWKAATQLVPTADPYTFTAPDFQYFMDSPVELSDFDLREWTVESGGKTYTIRIAMHHDGTAEELDRYTEMAKAVVREQIAVFGELPDFDYGSYVFIACYLPYVAGDGMEHRNSTILTSVRPLSTGALANLGTLSHEFIHVWSTERLRPASLEPFDFERANMSGELWFSEGVTSYYDRLTIRRAGLMSVAEYARHVGGQINAVVNSPGRRYFSPVEMSMQAPLVDQAVSVDPTNRANTFISYYTWGAMLGLGLDLTLRTRFPGLTLDDYMRAAWRRYGVPERPYTNEDLRALLAEVTGDEAFAREFFDRYVYGREVVDYEALLAPAGLLLRRARPGQPTLGASAFVYEGGAARVAQPTLQGTPLYEAGVTQGDRILTLDGRQVTGEDVVAAVLAARKPGDRVPVEYEQRGRRVRAELVLTEDPTLEVVPFEDAGRPVTAEIRAFREAWLGSRAGQGSGAR
ncbi:MAG TPA: PDZ domain-containing protein [Longimicrobiales bacterium]|nr:PDZ domain-containing protein [Longimicrobiales bacterium]